MVRATIARDQQIFDSKEAHHQLLAWSQQSANQYLNEILFCQQQKKNHILKNYAKCLHMLINNSKLTKVVQQHIFHYRNP
jgi:hypothetical protein